MLFTFVAFGRYIEHIAKGKTSEALSRLLSLQPPQARLLVETEDGDTSEETIETDLVQRGDHFRVGVLGGVLKFIGRITLCLCFNYCASTQMRVTDFNNLNSRCNIVLCIFPVVSQSLHFIFNILHLSSSVFICTHVLLATFSITSKTVSLFIIQVLAGEKFPVDGRVVSGTGQVDESMITGESRPITKQEGDAVIGGTILKTGVLCCEATNVGRDSSLARIVDLIEQAQTSKAPIQRIAGLLWC